MNSFLKIFSQTALFCLLFCLSKLSFTQVIKFENIDVSKGLSQSTIYKSFQDHLGYMWFCTEDGLNRYDGYQFKIYKHQEGDSNSILSSCIYSIFEDPQNNLWVFTNSSLSLFNRKTETFENIKLPPSFLSRTIYSMHFIKSDRMLFNTLKGMYYYHLTSKKWSIANDSKKSKIAHLILSIGDTHYLQNNSGIWLYDLTNQKTLKKISTPYLDKAIALQESIKAYCLNQKEYWIITKDIVYIVEANTFHIIKTFKTAQPEKNEFKSGFEIDAEGMVWQASLSGLFRINPKTLEYTKFKNSIADPFSLVNDYVRSIYKDRTGIIWIGTNGGGLSKLNPHKFKFNHIYPKQCDANSLQSKFILCFEETPDGTIWIGTDGKGIQLFNPLTQTFIQNPGLAQINDKSIFTLLYHSNMMYCGYEKGILEINIKNGIVKKVLELEGGYIKKIYKDNSGMIWAGGKELYKLNETKGHFDKVDFPAQSGNIKCLAEGPENSLWIGMDPGIACIDKITLQAKPIAKAIQTLAQKVKAINQIVINQNYLRIATAGLGLFELNLKNNSVKYYNEELGLANNSIYEIIADKQQQLWVSSNSGLSSVVMHTNKVNNFNTHDGLQSNEFNSGAAFMSASGIIFMGGINGFNFYDPSKLNINKNMPETFLTGVKIFDKDYNPDLLYNQNHEIELKYTDRYITFNFSTFDYTDPEKNEFSYMLEGIDNKWNHAGKNHSISYSNMPHGSYLLKVKSVNNDGIESNKILSLPIKINPPFWLNIWFKIVLALFGGILIWIILWRRLKTIEKENNIKLQFSEIRLKALQAQMNPHFIFNSLNSIQDFILSNNPTDAARYLSKFAKLVRTILDNSAKNFISLENVIDTLKTYVELESLRFGNTFDYQIRVDDDIDIHSIELPLMMFQPFVENAIWHGLLPKNGNKNLSIRFMKSESEKRYGIICEIKDNGVGRMRSKNNQTEHKSYGMSITSDIFRTMNQLRNIESDLSIIDLYHEDKTPAGTLVKINIPIKLK